ncbi:hypothetical protein G3O08_11595 [Cryomorpha ignava]|uniref:RHS repeat-associated core domain-containing protein n=2 Tax=Cryomorpha ignava TaxID=101383 RepID=A0A7K3WU09_9FLAO|nr:hypothetical protein [Cryomorpha ignava]
MERDDEVKGKGNSLDFGARIYDSRLGRWLSIDPLYQKYPSISPYNYAGNSPVMFIDIGGESIVPVNAQARPQLETVFASIFGQVPDVLSRIEYVNLGSRSDGSTIFGFTFSERDGDGNPVMTLRSARQNIRDSQGMNPKQKLEALATLNLLGQDDLTEFQTPRRTADEININQRMTKNFTLSALSNLYEQEELAGTVSENTMVQSTGSSAGAPGAVLFTSDVEVSAKNTFNQTIKVKGIINSAGGDQDSRVRPIIDKIIEQSGGASYKQDNTRYSLDSAGRVSSETE